MNINQIFLYSILMSFVIFSIINIIFNIIFKKKLNKKLFLQAFILNTVLIEVGLYLYATYRSWRLYNLEFVLINAAVIFWIVMPIFVCLIFYLRGDK